MSFSFSDLNISKGRAALISFLESNFGEEAENLIKKFDALTDAYFQFNSVINISALRTVDDVYIKHYLDSIYPYKHFVGGVCDVGCGGGFPCLPLAIITENNYLGIDGVGKKLRLISIAAEKLGLKNVTGEHVRAEELFKVKKFDTVCARAVADIDTALGFCAPLCKNGGKIILYRTQTDERAVGKTEQKNKIKLSDIIDYELPCTDIKRRLFIYEKL